MPIIKPLTDGSVNKSIYDNDKYGKHNVPLVNIGNGAFHAIGSITFNCCKLLANVSIVLRSVDRSLANLSIFSSLGSFVSLSSMMLLRSAKQIDTFRSLMASNVSMSSIIASIIGLLAGSSLSQFSAFSRVDDVEGFKALKK